MGSSTSAPHDRKTLQSFGKTLESLKLSGSGSAYKVTVDGEVRFKFKLTSKITVEDVKQGGVYFKMENEEGSDGLSLRDEEGNLIGKISFLRLMPTTLRGKFCVSLSNAEGETVLTSADCTTLTSTKIPVYGNGALNNLSSIADAPEKEFVAFASDSVSGVKIDYIKEKFQDDLSRKGILAINIARRLFQGNMLRIKVLLTPFILLLYLAKTFIFFNTYS